MRGLNGKDTEQVEKWSSGWKIGGVEKRGSREAKEGVQEYWRRNARMENVEGEFSERNRRFVEEYVRAMKEDGTLGKGWCEEGFRMEEVEEAMRRLRGKEWKASGGDEITNWMMMKGGAGKVLRQDC